MAVKNYKNVYTILEKVKKGEIQSHYTDKDGLFGKIKFYKKPDLIKPHMHWLDESKIDAIMDTYIHDGKSVKDLFNKFQKSSDYEKKIPDNKKPDFQAFHSTVLEKYKKFPKHMVKDVFKMFYHKMDKLEFEDRDNANYTKYKFLEQANNPVSKIMTEGSNLKSAIFSRNIMGYYLMRMAMLSYVDPDTEQKIENGLNGGDGEFGNNQDIDNAMNDLTNSRQGKNMLEQMIKEATDLCKQMDDTMDEDIQEQLFDNATASTNDKDAVQAGKLSPDYIRQISASLKRVKMSMGNLKQKIKKLLDKSVSYFSAKEDVIYEDLFNSDNIAGLEEYELLHPKLRKVYIEDVYVKDTKKVGKIDIYVDISGSMSSGCGVEDEYGNSISRIDFCKAFVSKLGEMDMLNNVYLFNNSVKKYKKDPISISMIDTSGGTSIGRAVEMIEKNKVNALIITDAEDGCYRYSDKAFFIGLKGCNFRHFSEDVIKQYSDNGQVVVFDGSTIKKVNALGNIVV